MWDMMTLIDIERLTNDKKKQERLIHNAMTACRNSVEEWPKAFWFDVWLKLCKKYNRMDLYNRNLH